MAMKDSVKIKAGKKATMPTLPDRELAWVRDEEALYIGTPTGNLKVTGVSSDVTGELEEITSAVMGAYGGCARLVDLDGDGMPDTLYLADNPDPDQAVNVWRFNAAGWGVSNEGYEGSFVMGASIETGIVADFITAGTINADLIKTGMLRSKDGSFSINLDTGELSASSLATLQDLAAVQADSSANAEDIAALKERVTTTMDFTEGLSLTVDRIVNDGVDKVKTSMGYSFDDDGMNIEREGEEIHNRIDHKGVYVDRTDENVMTADANGVEGINIKARNYMLIGNHSRVQDFTDENGKVGGAIFWLPAN